MKKILISFAIMFTAAVTFAFTQNSFPDVNPGDWFHQYVMQIKDWGIVHGDDDGYFNPGNNINRAEFSKMMVLYDERVDEKIEKAVKGLSRDINTENSSSKLASVMYITSYKNNPNHCPNNWNEAGIGSMPGGGKTNFTRTCYIHKACSVIYLSDNQKNPNNCPNGWTEASMDSKWVGSNELNHERICYVCE